MHSSDKLFHSTFQQEFSSPDAGILLRRIVKEYPYFIPSQYFLLKKDMEDQQQAAKTAILFNDPLWLNWLLMNDEEKKEEEPIPYPSASITDKGSILVELEQNEPETITIEKMPMELTAKKSEDSPIQKPIEKDEELIFEPLFASDYFASQGIKLSDEIKVDDKLGKQLKSFTEWLKSMKKVDPAKTMEEVTPVDITIQNMAEKSNTEGEVLTETMAEVFAQQGKSSKAMEVYEKLSLLNPSKSAYFAAKIEHLKSI